MMGAPSRWYPLSFLMLFSLIACPQAPVDPHSMKATLRASDVVHLGDIVAMDYDLPEALGRQLDLSSLPGIGMLDEALSIREIKAEDLLDEGTTPRQLHVVYQVFKSVKTPEALIIPSLHVRFKGDPPQEFDTTTRTLTIEPLIPAEALLEQLEIRAPHPPHPIDTQTAQDRLIQWLGAFGAALLLLLLRHWRHLKRSRPFAAIRRRCAKALTLRHQRQGLETAVRLIHRALNQTYGHTLFEKDLPRFFEDQSRFSSEKASLRDFFILSDAVFFDPSFDEHHHPEASHLLKRLLEGLIKAERGQKG